jgi:hypothetical protein
MCIFFMQSVAQGVSGEVEAVRGQGSECCHAMKGWALSHKQAAPHCRRACIPQQMSMLA